MVSQTLIIWTVISIRTLHHYLNNGPLTGPCQTLIIWHRYFIPLFGHYLNNAISSTQIPTKGKTFISRHYFVTRKPGSPLYATISPQP